MARVHGATAQIDGHHQVVSGARLKAAGQASARPRTAAASAGYGLCRFVCPRQIGSKEALGGIGHPAQIGSATSGLAANSALTMASGRPPMA